jgi:class 3 adenylate cyclase
MEPVTRYASSAGGKIAYQAIGDGPIDLVVVPGWLSHLDLFWMDPGYRRFLERLASFARVISFDKRGTGCSDPIDHAPTLEERMADLKAVLDAIGSERAALFGLSEGGPMSILFGATYPARTIALVLYGTVPTGAYDPDLAGSAELRDVLARIYRSIERWGEGLSVDWAAPSLASNERYRRAVGLLERSSMSPTVASAMLEANVAKLDVRGILKEVRVPTLVLHRVGEAIPVDMGRYLASNIPGAKMVELPGIDHFPSVGDAEALIGEVEEFLTGVRHHPESDRVLATVLFTDIVSSTERVARVGDRRWQELLGRHDELVRGQLERHRGREIKHTGDGIFATFDGPARAVRCGLGICREVAKLGLEIRAGVHTGECELSGDDVRGIAVHIGARVGALAAPGEVLVSRTVTELTVGSGIGFAHRGTHELKGVPGTWNLFAATGERSDERFGELAFA